VSETNTTNGGWTRAEQMVFYRLDQLDRRMAELTGEVKRAERDLTAKLDADRVSMDARLASVMGQLTDKVAALERQHAEQKVKVAALSAVAGFVLSAAGTWLVHQVFGGA
jgi:hypothetical protein